MRKQLSYDKCTSKVEQHCSIQKSFNAMHQKLEGEQKYNQEDHYVNVPLQGSVIADILFEGAPSISESGERFELANTQCYIEPISPENEYLFIQLEHPNANRHTQEGVLIFRLDEEKKCLVGDFRDYRLSNEQIESIKRLANHQQV